MPIENLLAMIIATLVLNLSPGPDMFYIAGRTLTQGRNMGIAAALGVCSGAYIHALAAILGLSAILSSSASLFLAVKFLGAAYLIYLGFSAIFSKANSITSKQTINTNTKQNHKQAFTQGMLTNILNPKVALFFMAFFPQFLSPSPTPETVQLFTLSIAFILTAILFQLVFVLLANGAATHLIKNTRAIHWINKIFGTLLIAIGLHLATTLEASD